MDTTRTRHKYTRVHEALMTREQAVRARWLQGAVLNGDATDAERQELHELIVSISAMIPKHDYSHIPTEGKSPAQIKSDKAAARRFNSEATIRLNRGN
jgi:hypothetical protein